MSGTDVDVLVVGAGPAGVTTGLLLAQQGLRVLVVDKHAGISPLPRARGVHARAVEILRQLGIETDMLARELTVLPRMEIRSTLADPPLHAVVTGGEELSVVSPCEGIAIAQDEFEAVLRDHLAREDSAELRVSTEMTDFASATDGVVATLLNRTDGSTTQVQCRYLIGADGWRSAVRTGLGVAMDGVVDPQPMRGISFRADLDPWAGSPPPALLMFPGAGAVLLSTHPDHRWASNGVDLPDHRDQPAEVVRARLGLPDLELEVLVDSQWTAAAQTAASFGADRIFLVGDAAHRVPPAGATGISAAMADAHNLAWKIAAVERGWAAPELLDTYDAERRSTALTRAGLVWALWEAQWTGGSQPPIDIRVLDMGYRYASSAVISDGQPAEPELSTYLPSALPGARAPHVVIERSGRPASTLDLFGSGFTLLTGAGGELWVDVADRSGIPVRAEVLAEPAVATAYAIGGTRAVLVRPDGHVGWRSPQVESGTEAAALLEQVLLQITGRTLVGVAAPPAPAVEFAR